ncbi:peptidylprolyl isomerase [Rhodococcus rhodnii]|nr:peptidylprolyl isomerase [Rhodococcus rhodnii]
MRIRTGAAIALGSVLVLAGCSNGDDTEGDATAADTTSTADAPAADLGNFPALPTPPEGGDPVTCEYDAQGEPAAPAQPPAATDVPATGTTVLTLATDAGAIDATLDRAWAPCTVQSIVSLADQGFYDGTPCHRLTAASGLSVLQCGDPSGRGNGGPGYQFADEYPATAAESSEAVGYPRGTLAMANAGPGTNGSQFFLVYEDSVLPPAYTVFGTISETGLEVLDEIAAEGTDNRNGPGDGAPNRSVTIDSATTS